MKKSTLIDVKALAKRNTAFRKVLFTGAKSQLVIMALGPGEDIGVEVHDAVDQLIYAVDGKGSVEIDGARQDFAKGEILCVAAGTKHNVINGGDEPLKLFTVYSPPQHPEGTVHTTKRDAADAEAHEAAPA